MKYTRVVGVAPLCPHVRWPQLYTGPEAEPVEEDSAGNAREIQLRPVSGGGSPRSGARFLVSLDDRDRPDRNGFNSVWAMALVSDIRWLRLDARVVAVPRGISYSQRRRVALDGFAHFHFESCPGGISQ